MIGAQRIHVGGILLAALFLLTASAQAGLPTRSHEDMAVSVLASRFESTLEALSGDHARVWSRFLNDLERARGRIRRPAVMVPGQEEVFEAHDLGDHFLEGFRRERGLNRKLKTLAEYRITWQRAQEWVETVSAPGREVLTSALAEIRAEVDAAEATLVSQIGGDLLRGGRALKVLVDHVNRSGLAEETAGAAFSGLALGLKRELTNLASTGQVNEETRSAHAQQIEMLEQMIGNSGE